MAIKIKLFNDYPLTLRGVDNNMVGVTDGD